MHVSKYNKRVNMLNTIIRIQIKSFLAQRRIKLILVAMVKKAFFVEATFGLGFKS